MKENTMCPEDGVVSTMNVISTETGPAYSSDVAFTSAVKAQQSLKGSRATYARMEEGGSWETAITSDLKAFVEAQTSFFMSTANAVGQPYIQHRGGPAGFLRVLDDKTIGFADYAGNRQYITLGNLAENPKVHLFLIDYAERRRIKIWGTARVVEDDPELTARLSVKGYKARPERALLISVAAWDVNCRQHIPQRFEAADVAKALAERDQRIASLEAEVARLRATAPPDRSN
jgi:predicted pyridoxine 5'-phosphate oxidase superfamily flavin-nucleotide-binding protein